jgi:hypothetical protein
MQIWNGLDIRSDGGSVDVPTWASFILVSLFSVAGLFVLNPTNRALAW